MLIKTYTSVYQSIYWTSWS